MQTKADTQGLSTQQTAAVDLLCHGQSLTAAAEALDLRRQTLSEWLNHNPAFQAGLNSRRQELWQAAADRLRSLADRAIDVLEESLAGEGELRFRAATQVLRCVGLYGGLPAPSGPTEPAEAALAEKEASWTRTLRELAAGG